MTELILAVIREASVTSEIHCYSLIGRRVETVNSVFVLVTLLPGHFSMFFLSRKVFDFSRCSVTRGVFPWNIWRGSWDMGDLVC
jgi:hypothetical protein